MERYFTPPPRRISFYDMYACCKNYIKFLADSSEHKSIDDLFIKTAATLPNFTYGKIKTILMAIKRVSSDTLGDDGIDITAIEVIPPELFDLKKIFHTCMDEHFRERQPREDTTDTERELMLQRELEECNGFILISDDSEMDSATHEELYRLAVKKLSSEEIKSMLLEKEVTHSHYGKGIIRSICRTIMEVEFDGEKRKFQYPAAFGEFLKLDSQDKKLLRLLSIFNNRRNRTTPPHYVI